MKTIYLALLVLFSVSCGSDDDQGTTDFTEINDQQIQEYLEENNLEAEKSNTGLYYIIEEQGSGARPVTTDRVRVAYKGYYLNGDVFDESGEDGVTFSLQQVIRGWTEGITYFNAGGSGILLVPSHLGYGPRDSRGIPGGSVLIFEINLLEVVSNPN